MKLSKFKKKFCALLLCMTIITLSPIIARAYAIDVDDDFSPVPAAVRAYMWFSDDTKTAVNNSCAA